MRQIKIYTDGSHLDKQNNGRLGCGGVMIENGQLISEFGEALEKTWLERNFGSSAVSNPTAEMIGLLMALRKFEIPEDAKVTVYADYTGVKSWMEGTWQVKEPYLKKVKEQIDKEIEAKNLKGRLKFEWIKAHQSGVVTGTDAYWNSYVDLLAKGQKV